MSKGLLLILYVAFLSAVLFADQLWEAASSKKKERSYPAPRVVRLPELNDEQIMFLARRQARNTESRSGRLGIIEPGKGKKGLIFISDRQDMRIMKAVVQALRERGADADYLYTSQLLEQYGYPGKEWMKKFFSHQDPSTQSSWERQEWGIEIQHYMKITDFSERVQAMMPGAVELLRDQRKTIDVLTQVIKDYLGKHPEYEYLFFDWFVGGEEVMTLTEAFGSKFQFGWRHPNVGSLAQEATVPTELMRVIEEKVLEVIPWARHVRITDPEGTDLEFSMTAEDAGLWRAGAYFPDYMKMYPFQAGEFLYQNTGIKKVLAPAARGILGCTSGHGVWWTSYMKVFIEDGMVQKVEGGGLREVMMNDMVENYKNIHFPFFPHPGWMYLNHLGNAVNPRQGLIMMHWAFGPQVVIPEVVEYAKKNNIHLSHDLHVANYFSTYAVTIPGGKDVKVIDKGVLTAWEDPEVRAIASKYGNPDDYLKGGNVLAMPGINAPGDYWKDYANDPWGYVANVRKQIAAGTYPYLVTELPADLRRFQK